MAAVLQNASAVADALCRSGQPYATLAAVDRGLADTVGHIMFTLLIVDLSTERNQRYYTNQPKLYPVGGSKPIVRTSDFFNEVIVAGKPRICCNFDDIKKAFFDHDIIHSLGCESAINYPIRWSGRTIGSLNVLHQAHWYTEADLPAIDLFATFCIAPILQIIGRP